MRQPNQRSVAPLNPDPKWPEGYVAVLREAGAVEKTIPFLMTWVRRFFARFPGRNRRDLGRSEIETFLVEMSRRAEISNWQIAQARDALELYYEQFRGIALAPRPDDGVASRSPATSPARHQAQPVVHEAANETDKRTTLRLPEPGTPRPPPDRPFPRSVPGYHAAGSTLKTVFRQRPTAQKERRERQPESAKAPLRVACKTGVEADRNAPAGDRPHRVRLRK